MSRKFARVPGFRVALACITITVTILAGAGMAYARQTPEQSPSSSQQQPPQGQPGNPQTSSQQSSNPQTSTSQTSNQEASTEEVGPVRKPKVKDYKNWAFNVGGGARVKGTALRGFLGGAEAASLRRALPATPASILDCASISSLTT